MGKPEWVLVPRADFEDFVRHYEQDDGPRPQWIDDALSRASIPGGVGVKVKPLEWSIERDGDALCWRASDPLGGWAYIRIHTDDELGECSYASETFRTAAEAQASFEGHRERRILSALDLSPAEGEPSDGSEQAAIEIADAVIAWMVRHDLLDADQEYRDDDIIAVLDELSPGLATTNDEAFASPLAAPSNPVISDEMAKRVFDAAWACPHTIEHGSVILRVDHSKPGNALRQLRDRITAALSVKPQSGER